jgi:HD-GYP domain-containing protein (c-di-GMP phosphodiesterase class II)
MNKQVPVSELRHGMFVAELDRPWLDTPFLLQGLLIDSDEQIEQLCHYCKFVYVDVHRSVGMAYEAFPPATSKRPQKIPTGPPPLRIRRAAAHSPLTETSKSSLIGDIKTILKESFATRREVKQIPTQRNAIDERPPFYHADHKSPTFSRTQQAQSRSRKPARNFERPSRADYLDAPLLIHGGVDHPGLLRQIASLFSRPTAMAANHHLDDTGGTQLDEGLEVVIYEDLTTVAEEMDQARASRAKSQQAIQDIVANIQKDRPLDADKVTEAVSGMVESIVRNPNALIWLTRLRERDSHAYGHAIDVSIYLIAFGRHLGYPKFQLNHLGIAGLLLDVGKLHVPQELLSRRGMLTPKEFEIVKQHVNHSLDIVGSTGYMPMDVLDAVAQHHERLDGSGYPHGLAGPDVSLFGAMAGIVDTFEALISERPYASAISAHEALKDLYSWRNHQFNGTLVEQFIQCLGIFPVGSLVELNTGDVAVVIAHNKIRRLKPKVLLILDPEKKAYANPGILDLIHDPLAFGDTPFEVRRALAPGMYGINPREYYL